MILKPVQHIDDFFELSETINGVFGSRKWLSVYDAKLIAVGIYKNEHQLIGGFYYLNRKKFGHRFIKLPPYTPYCGLFFIGDGKNKASVNSFSKEIITHVCNYFSALNPALLVLAFPPAIIDLQPFIWSKYKVVPNYTYRIDLKKDMNEIIANFDSKNRNAINKSLKEGVETFRNRLHKQELFDFFYQSLKSAGANIYKEELKNIFIKFSSPSNSFNIAAYRNNVLLGVVFCIFDKTTCYYLLGGINRENGIQGVNNLLMQKCLEYARELGCTVFDFEGSMLKGVEKFFRGFGPELIPYYTVNKAWLPLEIVLKFKKRELF